MKKIIKRILISLLAPVAKRLGIAEIKYKTRNKEDKDQLLDGFFTLVNRCKFQVDHIVDIGANHGTWTRKAIEFFPEANYTLVEPQQNLSSSHTDLAANEKVEILYKGVLDKPGTLSFTIHDRDDSSTFRMSEEEANERGFEQVEVEVITLNDLAKNSKFGAPSLVKIDAEGLDLKVLEGATDLFGKTEIFMIEASVLSRSFDNTVLAVISQMDTYGYKVCDITDLNRPYASKALWLVEIAFIKKEGVLDTYNYREG